MLCIGEVINGSNAKSLIFCFNKTHPKFEITNESNRKLIRVIFCLFWGCSQTRCYYFPHNWNCIIFWIPCSHEFLISWNLTKFHLPYSREQKHVSDSNMGCQKIKNALFLRHSGYLTNTWCVCQVSISKRSNYFYFLTPHVTNWKLLHFVAFFHVASKFSIVVDNQKVEVVKQHCFP